MGNIKYKIEDNIAWNRTHIKKAKTTYPENINELKSTLKQIKSKNEKYIIKTGDCAYDNKSIISNDENWVISLRKFNKVIKIDKKKKLLLVETGILMPKLVEYLRSRDFSLHSVPGGSNVSVGGAISANVIGKDSSRGVACFGDSVESIDILNETGKIRTLKKNTKELNSYIGAFGFSGIILRAKLKIKKTLSPNLNYSTKILRNIDDVKKELENKTDYKYIQLDPFFRNENFGIVFNANSIKDKHNLYKSINLNTNIFEKIFFKFSSFFINFITWRIFYKTFFIFNNNTSKQLDIYNFHYPSKYKHLIPFLCKNGLSDYEFLIKKDFKKTMNNIINFLKINKMYAVYIVVKKIYRSKNKYAYQFSDNGYAVAMAFDRNNASKKTFDLFEKKISDLKLKLNLSKSNYHITKSNRDKNNSFMSLFRKKTIDRDGQYI